MSLPRFTPEFKDEAVRQITERGYSVAEVSAGLGVSAHSLYKWVNAVKPDKTDQQASELLAAKSEILRLRAQLHRSEEERDWAIRGIICTCNPSELGLRSFVSKMATRAGICHTSAR